MAAPDLELDLRIAAEALATGDLGHSVKHLAGAFAAAPADPRVHAIFESISRRCAIFGLIPDDPFYGYGLLRAHALRRAGDENEAIVSLAQIIELLPNHGLESLLAEWLAPFRGAPAPLHERAAGQVNRLLATVSASTVGLHRLRPGERALLAGYGPVADALVAAVSDPDGRRVAPSVSGLLRRLGRIDDALAVLAPGVAAEDELALLLAGLALRTRGDGAGAASAFARAAAKDPANTKGLFEQARAWLVAGDGARALEFLERTGLSDSPEVVTLVRACREPMMGDRVEWLDALRRDELAARLVAPLDATAKGVRQLLAQRDPGVPDARMTVSGWESPSNRLLIALVGLETTDVRRARYEIESPELERDPLAVAGDGPPALWVARAGKVVQGMDAPAAELRAAIAAVAGTSDGIDAIWTRAAALAATLPPASADEVVAALVHPPTDRAWIATLPDGLYRYQVAGACVLATIGEGFSTTAPHFEALLLGPVDWPGGAAIIALTEAARRDANTAGAIRELLLRVVPDLLPSQCEPRFDPLHAALSTLPCIPPQAVEALVTWQRRHFPEEATSDGDDGEEPSPASVPEDSPAPDARPQRIVWWVSGAVFVVVLLWLILSS